MAVVPNPWEIVSFTSRIEPIGETECRCGTMFLHTCCGTLKDNNRAKTEEQWRRNHYKMVVARPCDDRHISDDGRKKTNTHERDERKALRQWWLFTKWLQRYLRPAEMAWCSYHPESTVAESESKRKPRCTGITTMATHRTTNRHVAKMTQVFELMLMLTSFQRHGIHMTEWLTYWKWKLTITLWCASGARLKTFWMPSPNDRCTKEATKRTSWSKEADQAYFYTPSFSKRSVIISHDQLLNQFWFVNRALAIC